MQALKNGCAARNFVSIAPARAGEGAATWSTSRSGSLALEAVDRVDGRCVAAHDVCDRRVDELVLSHGRLTRERVRADADLEVSRTATANLDFGAGQVAFDRFAQLAYDFVRAGSGVQDLECQGRFPVSVGGRDRIFDPSVADGLRRCSATPGPGSAWSPTASR